MQKRPLFVAYILTSAVLQVSFNRLVKERVFFEESVSDDEGGRASPVSRPYKEKHPGSFRMSEGEAFR